MFPPKDFDSWFDTNNCLGDTKLVERLHTVSIDLSLYQLSVHFRMCSIFIWVKALLLTWHLFGSRFSVLSCSVV